MSAARGGAILAAAIGIHAPIPSFADISIPTIIVGRFEKDGKPYNEPVQFTAHCFGWAAYPGDPGFPPGKKPDPYVPKEVFSFSATCPSYGCEIKNSLYHNYRYIEYCDMEGRAGGRPFKVARYGTAPVASCDGGHMAENGVRRCELKVTLPR